MHQSRMSSSSLQSLPSSSSFSSGDSDYPAYRGLRPAMLVTNQDMPFPLRMMSRSPREILEKKAEMDRVGHSGGDTVEDNNEINKMVVEKEIQVKLSYLGMINRLKEGGGCAGAEQSNNVDVLLMRIRDLEQKKDQAWRLIRQGEEQGAMMKLQLEEARQSMACLQAIMNGNKKVQTKTEIIMQAKLVTFQMQLTQAMAKNNDRPVLSVTAQAASCTQFSNLFCLSGQVDQLCMGEQGSKWVVDRLQEGRQEEKSLVRRELNLPQDLTKYIASPNCRKVILVLAEVDSQARKELLNQTSLEIDTILNMEGGQEFVEKLVKG